MKQQVNIITREDVETWLIENKDLVNNEGFDRKLKFPPGTIQKFLKYNRNLSDKRIMAIGRLLIKLSFIKPPVFSDQVNTNT